MPVVNSSEFLMGRRSGADAENRPVWNCLFTWRGVSSAIEFVTNQWRNRVEKARFSYGKHS